MPCYKPIGAYKCSNGDVVFSELKRYDITQRIELSCGQCIGCKLERSRQWAMRCVHESRTHAQNCFITLTYDEANLPKRNQLQYPDFQRFMKRLRKHARTTIRFYMCGEYGELNDRPHYHACLFGWDWIDKKHYKNNENGDSIYTSETLQKLWPYGLSSTADVTFQSAAYVARYCLKKINGDAAEAHYRRHDQDGEYQKVPEFAHMSLKPGIGAHWYNKYHKDVHTHDYVVINAKECRPPRYYDRLLKRRNPDLHDQVKEDRIVKAKQWAHDNTDERLKVKEEVTRARTRQLKRTL